MKETPHQCVDRIVIHKVFADPCCQQLALEGMQNMISEGARLIEEAKQNHMATNTETHTEASIMENYVAEPPSTPLVTVHYAGKSQVR